MPTSSRLVSLIRRSRRASGQECTAAVAVLLSFALAACHATAPPAPARGAATPAAGPGATSSVSAAAAAREAAVDAPDRSPEDKALDRGRQPLALLTFAGVKPGDRVAELMAGGGYTAELLARTVGPNGQVFGQNSPFILARFAQKPWSERLGKPVMARVVRVDRELDDPLPAEAQALDAVFLVMFYHDAVWQHVDRARMNAAVFRALRPGGVFVVVDHSARPGAGLADTESLHRIDEDILKGEIRAAGFRLDAEADFLRNPSDPRDWSTSPRTAGEKRGTSDRFVLRFVRP